MRKLAEMLLVIIFFLVLLISAIFLNSTACGLLFLQSPSCIFLPHVFGKNLKFSENFPEISSYSRLVLCDGYLRHMIIVEMPSHHFHHVLDLDCDIHSGQKYRTKRLLLALEFVLDEVKKLPST